MKELRKRDAGLVRWKDRPAVVPEGVELAEGDLLDPISVEKALDGRDLLNAVAPDELTHGGIVYGLAKKQQLKQIVYHSVFKLEDFKCASHFASKFAIESALREFDPPFMIIRPDYFFQNDELLKEPLSIFPMPLGQRGISAVDIRDIVEAAAIAPTSDGRLGNTFNLNGPNVLRGPGVAEIWSDLLVAEPDDIEILTKLLGHKPQSYADFTQETAES